MAENIRRHLLVSGRVQGVMFRAHAQKKAQGLGITGWVHNLLDGKVEIVCEGETEKVEQLVEWCRRGPSLAKVASVEIVKGEYGGEFEGFEIREFGF